MSLVSNDNSFETKSEPTCLIDMKDEPVYYGNNSTRGRFNNYKRDNSNSKQWKYNNLGTQHESMSTDKSGQKTNCIKSSGNIMSDALYVSQCIIDIRNGPIK